MSSKVSMDFLTCLLEECIKKKDLISGRRAHHVIVEKDLWWNTKLGSQLIRMFASCGSMMEALQVFSSLPKQNVYTWTAIITAHAQHGQNDQVLILYDQMQFSAVKPNSYTLVSVLNACASIGILDHGKVIHTDIIKQGLETDLFLGNTLIDVYAKCGSLQDANKVFHNLPVQDLVSWNAMIAGYVQHGQSEQALKSFDTMQLKGIEPNKITFTCILKACASLPDLEQGKVIHSIVMKRGLQTDLFFGNTLVDMYAKCGHLEDAHRVFDTLSVRNMVSWSAMILGCTELGHADEALLLFQKMCQEGTEPNEITYACVLGACTFIAAHDQGKVIHAEIVNQGLELDIFIGSSLIDMYAICNSLYDAQTVFDSLPVQDVVTWSTLIAGYADKGHSDEAFHFFEKMQHERIEPNDLTYVSILKACGSITALADGKLIHASIIKNGLESHPSIGNALIDMYAKDGSLKDAQEVFEKLIDRNVISWSAIIAGYAEHGQGEDALELFYKAKQEGTEPNEITFVGVLRACGNIPDLEQGKLIHSDVSKQGCESVWSLGNTLVDMYVKCNSLEDAHEIFDHLLRRDIIVWNTIISGYVQHGLGQEALELSEKMQWEGLEPDNFTFVCLLKACASMAALDQGKLTHTNIMKRGLQSDLAVGTTLVNMYAKCGNLKDACRVFDSFPVRDVVAWNAMIYGYASHGHWIKALEYFESMQQEGIKPVDVTFVCLLSACGCTGLISEGYSYFKSMKEDHCIIPTIQHCVCMIDLLGRAGCLNEAEDFVLKMPFQPDYVVWVTLLSACAKYRNVEVGRRAFDCLVKTDNSNASGYVLMSNIYAANHMWEDALRIQNMRTPEKA